MKLMPTTCEDILEAFMDELPINKNEEYYDKLHEFVDNYVSYNLCLSSIKELIEDNGGVFKAMELYREHYDDYQVNYKDLDMNYRTLAYIIVYDYISNNYENENDE